MAFDLSFASTISFITALWLLLAYSYLDLRERRVKNQYIVEGVLTGVVMLLFTGHFWTFAVLHVTAIVLCVPLAYVLFRLGSIGGADAKVLLIVSFISPGIELGIWTQPVMEAIVGLGLELTIMLLGGYLYWKSKKTEGIPPLIPFLLVGYLAIQLLAVF